MLIEQDKVVLIHYTLTDEAGKVLDSSSGGNANAYLHGQGNVISDLKRVERQARRRQAQRARRAGRWLWRARRRAGAAGAASAVRRCRSTAGHAIPRADLERPRTSGDRDPDQRRHGDRGRQPPAGRRSSELRRGGRRGPRRHAGRTRARPRSRSGRAPSPRLTRHEPGTRWRGPSLQASVEAAADGPAPRASADRARTRRS